MAIEIIKLSEYVNNGDLSDAMAREVADLIHKNKSMKEKLIDLQKALDIAVMAHEKDSERFDIISICKILLEYLSIIGKD